MLERLRFNTREEWLAGRGRGIGASEAAAVIGMNPWMTPLQLWRLKLGMGPPKDLSDNAAVQQGNQMEPVLRDFFAAIHPEYKVGYFQYDILFQAERPWLFATLDGELVEYSGSKRRDGILEIKTATPNGKAGWAEWSDGKMKPAYYIQVLHQLLATGYDFVRLIAALYSMNGDITIRQYEVERNEVEDDLAWLLERETEFWEKNILGGVMPSMPLML
jgi:putative phage-type endonuclease